MAYWLFKSEPGAYSFAQLRKDKRTCWDGVRNYQANNNMKAMKKGDKGFFYHSVNDKEIVGVVEVVKGDSERGVEVRELFRFEPGDVVDGEITGRFVATSDLDRFHHHFHQYGIDASARAQPNGQARKLTDLLPT